MPAHPITSLHNGMNLRDPAAEIVPGETGITIGCDFSIPGQIRPMRQPLLAWTLAANIQDAAIIYLGQTKYLFTTHADGLRVTYSGTTLLIDANFTGNFKALSINDEYVLLFNSTLNRKWKPTWSETYEWGLNTPPDPTLAAGTRLSKTIDSFEDLTYWAFSGGGGSGALAADTVHYRTTGIQSMKLTCDAGETIIATRTLMSPQDLSMFSQLGDAGQPFIALSYYTADLSAVQFINIRLSCAEDGSFDKDYYQMNIDLGGYSNVQLASLVTGSMASATAEALGAIQQGNLLYDAAGDSWYILNEDGSTTQLPNIGKDQSYAEVQKYIIEAQTATIASSSNTWTDLKMQTDDFARIGSTTGRNWSTITAISIEIKAGTTQAIVSFDDFKFEGGGNLVGNYWVAVAYQNELGNYGPFTSFIGPIYLNAQSLIISNLTPDTDGQTIKRRLAVLGGSLTQPMVSYVEDNTSSSYEYNEEDNSLTTVETNFNNHKPPSGISDALDTAGRVFFVIGTAKVFYSEPLYYEAFPARNYIITEEGEQLIQVDVPKQNYVALRGRGKEHFLQLSGTGPLYWQLIKGADVGAVSSRLLLKDPGGGRVYVSKVGFYISGEEVRGKYLPKIDPVISDFSAIFGAMMLDRAYLYFQDTSGIDRIMRIDWRLGKPVAHYVANEAPTTIFADEIVGAVYYAVDDEIYEFDANSGPLPTTLTIPEQLCGISGFKDFVSLNYSLTGEDISFGLSLDRETLVGSYTLGEVNIDGYPVTLPDGTGGNQLGIVMESTTEDWVLILPLNINYGVPS